MDRVYTVPSFPATGNVENHYQMTQFNKKSSEQLSSDNQQKKSHTVKAITQMFLLVLIVLLQVAIIGLQVNQTKENTMDAITSAADDVSHNNINQFINSLIFI